MTLIEVNPFDIHFGDAVLETDWTELKGLNKDLIMNVVKYGILDPIVVYGVDNNPYLRTWIKDDFLKHKAPYPFANKEPSGLYCWRGTQRLRMARWMGYKMIRCLLFDEPETTILNTAEVQRYFKKKIKIIYYEALRRWDVLGENEPENESEQYIYNETNLRQ